MLIFVQIVSSQDKIITNTNDTIACKIILVSSKHIKFEEKGDDGYKVVKFIEKEYVSEYIRQSKKFNLKEFRLKKTQSEIIESEKSQPENIQLLKHEIAFLVGDSYSLLLREIGGPFGSYSVSYHYRYKKWFWYGAILYPRQYGFLM